MGTDNWRSVLTDASFGNSLLVTLAFIALVVPVQIVLGMALAALLARDLPGSGFFRTVYVLPWICAPLAIAVLWRWILAPTDGAVATVLGRHVEWLTDPGLALPVVSAVTVWTNVGYVALFFLAGMLSIPPAVHDAARIHGISMMVFLAATIWVLVQLRRHQRPGRLTTVATSLLTVLILQGAIGYTQYFTGVPPLLVGLHILGASLVWVAVVQLLLHMSEPLVPSAAEGAQSSGEPRRPDHVPDGDLVP